MGKVVSSGSIQQRVELSAEGIELVRKRQHELGLRRSTLARLSNVSETTVSRFLAGMNVSRDVFESICNALDLDWEAVSASSEHEILLRLEKRHLESLRGLTPKPRKVLLFLLSNKTDKEISIELGCSTATVRKHVQNLCDRFGIKKEVDGLQRNRREDLIEYLWSKLENR